METDLEGMVHDHHTGLLLLTVITCLIGSLLTVVLTRRMIKTSKGAKLVQLALVSIIGGATIWSTHFTAMLAFDPGVTHAYEPVRTIASLAAAASGLLITNAVVAYGAGLSRILGAGILFGMTVSIMHYTGMSAYEVPGRLVWDPLWIGASVVAGTVLGAMAYHRVIVPVTRFCWLAGTALMIMAICAMHFSGMAAFEIVLDPSVPDPNAIVSDSTFAEIVFAVTGLLYVLGFFSFRLELESNWQLRFAELHDPLTSLPNRTHLVQRFETIAGRMEADAFARLGVLILDVDGFQQINSLYGRTAGDFVLQTLASRLTEVLGTDDWVARTGSDEFVVLKTDFRQKDQLVALADRIRAQMSEPVPLPDNALTVNLTIGIASSLSDGREPEVLLSKAEVALNHAKANPDLGVLFFEDEFEQQDRAHVSMIEDLRRAIADEEFALVYQRQNALDTLNLVGFEALIRWDHPTRGRIPPNLFIPLAEETGLIREIGNWVLRTACTEAASWPQPYSIAVNVAPQQLMQPSFVDQVAFTLDHTGLDPARLELEVTEATVIDDTDYTRAAMMRLKDLGVRIAMDDFGTGYSSLATLRAFPFDKIKIDRSFITDVHENRQNAAIVRSTLLLGDALDIPVLAEGAENASEIEFLQAEKCDFVQGYFFGTPMSCSDMRDVVFGNAVQSDIA